MWQKMPSQISGQSNLSPQRIKRQILTEKERWEIDREEIRARINLNGDVVAINVGGTHHMMTERDVLQSCKGSILEKMFNGLHELKIIDNEVFLDRDGPTFTHLVNYLRNNREVLPDFYDQNEEKLFL